MALQHSKLVICHRSSGSPLPATWYNIAIIFPTRRSLPKPPIATSHSHPPAMYVGRESEWSEGIIAGESGPVTRREIEQETGGTIAVTQCHEDRYCKQCQRVDGGCDVQNHEPIGR